MLGVFLLNKEYINRKVKRDNSSQLLSTGEVYKIIITMVTPVILSTFCLLYTSRSLNVFIYASSMAERRERANQIDNIPMTDADSYIHMKDKQRRDYYKMYAEKEWGDPLNYDLCMNSSALGYDRCVELIERAL